MQFGEIATQYAKEVVKGKILACKWVRLAAQRHLDDLKASRTKDFPFRFDEDKVDQVCRFVELMPHIKGEWAARRELIRLQPWQVFILASLFGWTHKETGYRRYRKAYICIPRKNTKSTLAAAIGNYMLAADGEHGAEVYCGATTLKQAEEVFIPAKRMAEKSPDFRDAFGVQVNARNLNIASSGSKFEPVIGSPGDGSSPSCAIVDEYHEHNDSRMYDTFVTGMGARQQPLMLVITTAGEDIAGPCHILQQDVEKILEGTTEDDETFGLIYSVDDGTDWTTEEALRMANPNYGVSVGAEFLKAQQKEAIRSAHRQNVFKTKHLNTWVNSRSSWMNMELFNRLNDAPDESEFDGEPCWLGLDFAAKLDLTSIARIYKREIKGQEHFYLYGSHYLPEATANDPTNKRYHGWVYQGHLIATDGAVTDYSLLERDIVATADRVQIQEIAYDAWNTAQTAQRLEDEFNLPMVEVPFRVQYISEPMKTLEALVHDGRLHHTGCPVLTWAMSNVTVKTDANENIFPRKERNEQKIDPVDAALMALSRAIHGEVETGSVYDERGGEIIVW